MDDRIRKLWRKAAQGDPSALAQYWLALLQAGDLHGVFNSLAERDANYIANVTLMTQFLQAVCISPSFKLIMEHVRQEALRYVVASQSAGSYTMEVSEWKPWHAYLVVGPSYQKHLDRVRRDGFIIKFEGGNEEDWRQDQEEHLCSFFVGEYQRATFEGPLTERTHGSVWIQLDCKMGEPLMMVSWLDNDDYLDWEGVDFETSRLAGEPNGILGSYRVNHAADEGGEDRIGGQVISQYPEMILHIIPCHGDTDYES